MKTILFVRHGQSEAQVGVPTSAPGAAHLTDLGREQASITSEFLAFAPWAIGNHAEPVRSQLLRFRKSRRSHLRLAQESP